MTYPRITEGIRTLTNPADHALLDACDAVDAIHASLEDENERLQEELSKWERLTAGIDLPEYPITEFKPKDLERENAKLLEIIADLEELLPESERWYSHETVKAIAEDNAKLRELVKEVFYKLLNVAGGRRELTAGEAQRTMDRMHELGVEVDG